MSISMPPKAATAMRSPFKTGQSVVAMKIYPDYRP
jgi:hypothetical protein